MRRIFALRSSINNQSAMTCIMIGCTTTLVTLNQTILSTSVFKLSFHFIKFWSSILMQHMIVRRLQALHFLATIWHVLLRFIFRFEWLAGNNNLTQFSFLSIFWGLRRWHLNSNALTDSIFNGKRSISCADPSLYSLALVQSSYCFSLCLNCVTGFFPFQNEKHLTLGCLRVCTLRKSRFQYFS